MTPESDVEKLIARLRQSTSLTDQLKNVVRSWRLVRAMPTEQRIQVARQVGTAEAGQLLERLGHPQGISPARLLRAVELAEKADPRELKRLFSELREPEGRERAFDKSLELLETVLGEEQPVSLPIGPSESPAAEPAETPPPIPSTEADSGRPSVSDAQPPPPPADRQKERSLETETEAPGISRTPTARETGRSDTWKSAGGPGATLDDQPPAPAAGPSGTATPRKPVEPLRMPPQGSATRLSESDRLVQALDREASLVGRFRLLRESMGRGENISDPKKILGRFTEGWARRRAFCSMIQARAIDRAEAVELLETVSPEGELFCVSTLLRAYDFSRQEFERLAHQIQSSAARRYIRRALVARTR